MNLLLTIKFIFSKGLLLEVVVLRKGWESKQVKRKLVAMFKVGSKFKRNKNQAYISKNPNIQDILKKYKSLIILHKKKVLREQNKNLLRNEVGHNFINTDKCSNFCQPEKLYSSSDMKFESKKLLDFNEGFRNNSLKHHCQRKSDDRCKFTFYSFNLLKCFK